MKTRVRGLTELARLYQVELSYEGMDGERRRAHPAALALTLRALGAQLAEPADAGEALRARRAELDATGIQPVIVAWEGALPYVRVRLHAREAERTAIVIRLESGEVITHDCRAEAVSARPRAGWQATHALRFGRRLPLGYHQLQVETSGATYQSLIIAAPRRAHAPEARAWGVFFPLYALCSEHSWGTGDYTTLATAARWIGRAGGGFISTLPLLATFLEAPFDPSPYSPVSRLFWNELFIDVSDVPGWNAAAADLESEVASCDAGSLVDYRRTAALKRRELQRALRAVADDAATRADLAQFVAAKPRVEDYARFRAVGDRLRAGWSTWPDRLRDGELRDGDFAPEDLAYHRFVQWQADRQLGAVSAARTEGAASLYLDMPLGVNPESYDSWRFRELFAIGVTAGAPPDPLFTGGQNWGFRPLIPAALRASGYAYLIESLREHFRFAPMLRLDHVMSLYRLFWVPEGVDARDGIYVRYPDDELFAVLILESARHRAVVVGEDLGTVPAAVRRAMDRHAIHRMHVVQFEAAPDREPPIPSPEEAVVASLNTHDMPLFAGFWRGSEIDDQLDLGLIDSVEHAAGLARRADLRRRLSRLVGAEGEIDAAIVRQRLLERLADSPARYVLLTLEDLWLEDRPQNVPGTSAERPNWQRRARRSLDEIISDGAVRRMLHAIADRRAQHTRTSGP